MMLWIMSGTFKHSTGTFTVLSKSMARNKIFLAEVCKTVRPMALDQKWLPSMTLDMCQNRKG